MGLFKKPVVVIDNDEEIRREIRARVAKQVGIHDEDYVNTGIIGGKKSETPITTETNDAEEALVSDASETFEEPIAEEPEETPEEPEIAFGEPVTAEPEETPEEPAVAEPEETPEEPAPAEPEVVLEEPAPAEPGPAVSKPAKEGKAKSAPKEMKGKSSKPTKKKRRNTVLLIILLLLLVLFVPVYYFLMGTGSHAPVVSVSSTTTNLLPTEPLLIQGEVADKDINEEGTEVYYSIDNGTASILFKFEAGPGPFGTEITLPDTSDFIGDHTLYVYAKDVKGQMSEVVTLKFTVSKPLTDIKDTKDGSLAGQPSFFIASFGLDFGTLHRTREYDGNGVPRNLFAAIYGSD